MDAYKLQHSAECIDNSINGVNYSTEEQCIGTWINGKPLYQKTLEVVGTTHDITDLNIENAWIYDGYVFYSTDVSHYPLFWRNSANEGWFGSINNTTFSFTCRTATNAALLASACVTIRYTKTTDVVEEE